MVGVMLTDGLQFVIAGVVTRGKYASWIINARSVEFLLGWLGLSTIQTARLASPYYSMLMVKSGIL
jgi:hypothetical protein